MAFSIADLFAGMTPGSATLSSTPTAYAGPNAAPVLNFNNGSGQAVLNAAGSMGAGWTRMGAGAFMPGDIDFYSQTWGNNADSNSGANNRYLDNNSEYNGLLQGTQGNLAKLASTLGYNLGGTNLNTGYNPLQGAAYDQARVTGNLSNLNSYGSSGQTNYQNLYDAMNNDLKDFARVRGASTGWDGKNNARSTAETLYYQSSPGVWEPISESKFGQKAEHKGWAREEGADTIAALSMIMPAFGGWAGLLGNGTAGTLTAGGGLGVTSGLGSVVGNGLANTLVNAGVNGALNGGINPTSLLASLGMQAATPAGLNNMFNTNVSTAIGQIPTNLNSFLSSGLGSQIRQMPFFRTQGGAYANQGIGGIQQLARLFG